MVQKLATAWLKGAKGVSVSVNTVDADTLPAPWHVSTTVRFFTNDGSDREKINELAKQLAALQKLDDKKFWCVTRRPPSVPRPRRRAPCTPLASRKQVRASLRLIARFTIASARSLSFRQGGVVEANHPRVLRTCALPHTARRS